MPEDGRLGSAEWAAPQVGPALACGALLGRPVVLEELTLVGGAFKFHAVADGLDCPGGEGPLPGSSKLLLGMRSGFESLVTRRGEVSTRRTEGAVR